MCNKHVHADLMLEYAKDAQETDSPWERWEGRVSKRGRWIGLMGHPSWNIQNTYRRKRNTHIVNGKEVAAPLDDISEGQYVWVFHLVTSRHSKVQDYCIRDISSWQHELRHGILFATKEDAQENFDAHFPSRNLKV